MAWLCGLPTPSPVSSRLTPNRVEMATSMNLRVLLEILSDGSFHSGEELGRLLATSKAEVRRQIESLRSMGVDVLSSRGKGYRLPQPASLLNRESILEMIDAAFPAWSGKLEVLFSTSSTNKDAMKYAQQGGLASVHVAEHQVDGRGRRGKEWQSPLGSNIYFSMLMTLRSGFGALEGLSLAVAVMVCSALRASGYSGFRFKWPNDILLDGKKVAGILLEVTGDVSGPCKVVMGVGINTQLPEKIKERIGQPVTDLVEKYLSPPDRNQIVANLVLALTRGVAVFEEQGFAAYREPWEAFDEYRGREVTIGNGSEAIRGVVLGVNEKGALMLETSHGIKTINAGELIPSMRSV